MTRTLVLDLVAIIRQAPGDPGPLLAARLENEPFSPSEPLLQELARRARAFDATDEELGLSLGALLATARAPVVEP